MGFMCIAPTADRDCGRRTENTKVSTFLHISISAKSHEESVFSISMAGLLFDVYPNGIYSIHAAHWFGKNHFA